MVPLLAVMDEFNVKFRSGAVNRLANADCVIMLDVTVDEPFCLELCEYTRNSHRFQFSAPHDQMQSYLS